MYRTQEMATWSIWSARLCALLWPFSQDKVTASRFCSGLLDPEEYLEVAGSDRYPSIKRKSTHSFCVLDKSSQCVSCSKMRGRKHIGQMARGYLMSRSSLSTCFRPQKRFAWQSMCTAVLSALAHAFSPDHELSAVVDCISFPPSSLVHARIPLPL